MTNKNIKFIKKNYIIFLLLSYFLFFITDTSYGKIYITIDAENEIAFKSGKFDPNTFNGNLNQVEFINNGNIVSTANNLIIKSSGKPLTEDYFIKYLEIKDLNISKQTLNFDKKLNNPFSQINPFLTANSEKIIVKVENIIIKNFPFNLENIKGDISVKSDNISVDFLLAKINGKIDSIELDFIDIVNISQNKIKLPLFSKFKLKNFELSSTEENEFSETYNKFLESANLSKVFQSLFIEIKNEPRKKNLFQNISINYDISEFLNINSELNYFLPLSLFNNIDLKSNKTDRYMGLSQEMLIKSFYVEFLDKKFVQFLNKNDNIKSTVSEKTYYEIEKHFFKHGNDIALPIANFLHQGGKLKISLSPREPKNLLAFLMTVIQPDILVENFNLRVNHN